MESVKVMIVDDDPSIRLTLQRWLRASCGIEAVEVADGMQALERLSQDPADLILLDETMPELNGLEMLEILRADPQTSYLEVVMTSTCGDRSQIERALKLGVSDYLVKPLSFQRSESRIQAAVERVRALQRSRRRAEKAGEPRLLIAAPDTQTRELAADALGDAFDCSAVATLGGLYVAAYRRKPHLVIVANSLPGLREERAISKIEAAAGRTPPRVVLLGGEQRSSNEEPRFAGRLPDLPTPDSLRSLMSDLVQHNAVDPENCETWLGQLEPRFVSAVEECFASMSGTRIRQATTEELESETASWSIDLRPPSGGYRLRGSLCAVEGVGRAAAMGMLGLKEDELDDQIVNSCMSEALNLFGGRLKAAASELQVELRMGLPQREAGRGSAPYEWRQMFHWDENLRFEAVVEAYSD